MPSVGAGCHELRIVDGTLNWRIMYHIANDAGVILDVFKKQTPATPTAVIVGCRRRLAEYQRLTSMKKGQRHAKR